MKYGTENLVVTEKNIFAYKLFLLLNISDFNFFFYVKIAPPLPSPLKKVIPSFSASTSKSWGPVKPPFFKILFQVQLPSQQKRRNAYFGGLLSFLTEKIDWCFSFILNLCGIFLSVPFLRSSDLDFNNVLFCTSTLFKAKLYFKISR